jgi:hypothetical protein
VIDIRGQNRPPALRANVACPPVSSYAMGAYTVGWNL